MHFVSYDQKGGFVPSCGHFWVLKGKNEAKNEKLWIETGGIFHRFSSFRCSAVIHCVGFHEPVWHVCVALGHVRVIPGRCNLVGQVGSVSSLQYMLHQAARAERLVHRQQPLTKIRQSFRWTIMSVAHCGKRLEIWIQSLNTRIFLQPWQLVTSCFDCNWNRENNQYFCMRTWIKVKVIDTSQTSPSFLENRDVILQYLLVFVQLRKISRAVSQTSL